MRPGEQEIQQKRKEQKMLRLRQKWRPKANTIRTAGQTGAERVYPRRAAKITKKTKNKKTVKRMNK